ncbi:dienelactone hydrolase family protein [Ancylobacter defluvii]|uniref:Carboxymethylenebutenolidase n=1 Tax=Ancylobacter defluvii TaxID=1282440 RepID=A0A9W6NAZ3_9HYPH|nr:dienelactone hydrolase family protein [Ancylobacter defluvii]MBS7589385.1 dienelactone hydrolase family protein [Ancylobacter defluvii]GLK84999.1 carboxymethylenebutenolidase [Ancylobacter defluvii]
MDQRIIDLYDRFTHGQIGRRDFMDGLITLAGSVAAASAMLPLLSNDYARAAVVAEDDPRLDISTAGFLSGGKNVSGLLARAKRVDAKRPAVLVIHENRGLNPHIRDITRRLALEGYLAFGIDLLSADGGTPADEDKARDMIAALDRPATLARAVDAVAFLARHEASTGSVGAVGFCWGGGMVNLLAEASPQLKAGVAYYGAQPPLDKVPDIKAALLLQYGGLDTRINEGIPPYEEALKKAGKDFTIHIYEGANHAFNNDTNPTRYDPQAAALAWTRTGTFLAKHLGPPPPVET